MQTSGITIVRPMLNGNERRISFSGIKCVTLKEYDLLISLNSQIVSALMNSVLCLLLCPGRPRVS